MSKKDYTIYLRHIVDYMGVDLDEIQKIVSARLPRLRSALKAILRNS